MRCVVGGPSDSRCSPSFTWHWNLMRTRFLFSAGCVRVFLVPYVLQGTHGWFACRGTGFYISIPSQNGRLDQVEGAQNRAGTHYIFRLRPGMKVKHVFAPPPLLPLKTSRSSSARTGGQCNFPNRVDLAFQKLFVGKASPPCCHGQEQLVFSVSS